MTPFPKCPEIVRKSRDFPGGCFLPLFTRWNSIRSPPKSPPAKRVVFTGFWALFENGQKRGVSGRGCFWGFFGVFWVTSPNPPKGKVFCGGVFRGFYEILCFFAISRNSQNDPFHEMCGNPVQTPGCPGGCFLPLSKNGLILGVFFGRVLGLRGGVLKHDQGKKTSIEPRTHQLHSPSPPINAPPNLYHLHRPLGPRAPLQNPSPQPPPNNPTHHHLQGRARQI